jgi:type VI secretion system secreted protein Hcp
MSRSMFVLLAGLASLASGVPAFAQEIECTVTGAKQGMFQGDRGSKSTQIPVLFLTEAITVPRDPTTGLPSGRRTHEPLTIVKELDASSIQFFQAAVTNEVLRSVTCTFYRAYRSGTGASANAGRGYFRITLTNALIVEYKDAGDGINGEAFGDEHERISLTYQRIELTDLDSNLTSSDDWATG